MYKNPWEKRRNRGAEKLWSAAGKEKMLRGKIKAEGFYKPKEKKE